MKRFNPVNLLFPLVVAVAIVTSLMMYSSFNKVYVMHDFSPAKLSIKNFSGGIDICSIHGGNVTISGWAADPSFIGDMYRANTYPVINADGKYYKLRPTKKLRIDVSSYYKKPGVFDYAGFESKAKIKHVNISKQIYLVTDDGETMKGVSYVCK